MNVKGLPGKPRCYGVLLAVALFAAWPVTAKTIRVPEDFAAIQAAIDASAAGDMVQVGAGTYAEVLRFKSGITLQGAGADTTMVSVPFAQGEVLKIEGVDSGTVSGCTFRHADVQALKQDRKEWPDAVVITNARVTLKQCRLGPSAGCGVVVSGKSEAEITECTAEGNVQYGITARDSDASLTARGNTCVKNTLHGLCVWNGAKCRLEKNTCSENGKDGIDVEGPGAQAQVIGNICERNGSIGLAADNRASGSMDDNQCRANKESGIRVHRGATFTLDRNLCEKNLAHGIEVYTAFTEVTLTGNTSQENTLNGIAFLQGAHGTVRENHCLKNQWSGIAVSSWDSEVLIEKNDCGENVNFGICVGIGSKGTVRGNTCRGNQQHGICVTDEGTEADIGENTVEGPGEAVFRNAGQPARTQYQIEEYTGAGWLLAMGHYDELERLAARLRASQSRYINGQPQLEAFYDQLLNGFGLVKRKNQEAYLPALDKWQEAFPDSVAQQIVRGSAYVLYGWDIRGPGFASEVKPDAWAGFHENVRKGMEILEQADAGNPGDPELYVKLIDGGMDDGRTQEQMNAFFEKGVALDRSYAPLYTAMALQLLPNWHGKPGDIERFAERAAGLTREDHGDGMYALVALWTLRRSETEGFLDKYHFNWARIKQGMEDFLKVYPKSNFHWNQYCLMACVYGDQETAQSLFDRIGDNIDIEYTWGDEAAVRKWKRWTQGKGEPPVKASTREAWKPDGKQLPLPGMAGTAVQTIIAGLGMLLVVFLLVVVLSILMIRRSSGSRLKPPPIPK